MSQLELRPTKVVIPLALYWAWSFAVFQAPLSSLGLQGTAAVLDWLVPCSGGILGLLLVMLFPRRPDLGTLKALLTGVSLLLVAGTLGMWAVSSGSLGGSIACVIGAGIGVGATSALSVYALLWQDEALRLETIAISIALSGFVSLVMMSLQSLVYWLVAAAVPLAAGFLLLRELEAAITSPLPEGTDAGSPSVVSPFTKTRARYYAMLAAICAVVGVCLSFSHIYSNAGPIGASEVERALLPCLSVVLSGVVLLVSGRTLHSRRTVLFLAWSIILVAGTAVAVSLLFNETLVSAVLVIARTCCVGIIWLVCTLSPAGRVPGLREVALRLAIYQAGLLFGCLVFYVVEPLIPDLDSLLLAPALLTLLLLLVISTALLATAGASRDSAQSQPPTPIPTLSQVCASVAARYSLTSRETEVLELLVSGSDRKEAASILGISVETAKTHIGHIYEKTGAHSNAQLVRRVWEQLENDLAEKQSSPS